MLKKIVYTIIVILILASCNFIGSKNDISTSHDIEIARYDRLQYEFVTTNSVYALQKMNTEYPRATKILIEDLLSIGKVDDNQINRKMKSYLSDSMLLALFSDAERKFEDLTPIEEQLTLGFTYLKKELPEIIIPRVYAQFSALNQSIVIGDSLLGFSIDKYMGSDYPLYKRFYYDHQSRTMNEERIPVDCLAFYLQGQFPISEDYSSTLLDLMLYKGKIYWIVSKALDYNSFDRVFGYSKQEGIWCRQNMDKLLDTVIHRDKAYIGNTVFAKEFVNQDSLRIEYGDEAPIAISVWLGVELVDRYMRKNKKTTIQQLIHSTDYRKILSDLNIK